MLNPADSKADRLLFGQPQTAFAQMGKRSVFRYFYGFSQFARVLLGVCRCAAEPCCTRQLQFHLQSTTGLFFHLQNTLHGESVDSAHRGGASDYCRHQLRSNR